MSMTDESARLIPEPICKGCYALGSACGKCQRCTEEVRKLFADGEISELGHTAAMRWGELQRTSNFQVEWFHTSGPLMAFRISKRAEPDFNIRGGGGCVAVVEVFNSVNIGTVDGHQYSSAAPLMLAKFQAQTDTDALDAAKAWVEEMHRKFVFINSGAKEYDLIRVFKDGNQWCALLGENLQEGRAGFGNTKSLAIAELAVGMSEGKVIRKIPEEDRQTHNKVGANAEQYGGTHYKTLTIQPWDYILANGIGYCEGCAIKYLTRWKDKGGIEDLKKAQHYIQKLIEKEESRENR
jgi:hypothetical protein